MTQLETPGALPAQPEAPDRDPQAPDGSPQAQELDKRARQAQLTAVLFSAGEVVSTERLAAFLGLAEDALRVLVEEAAGMLRPLGLDILSAAGGYRLVTAAQWDEALRQFHQDVRRAKLTRSALEILAIIAYEQPVSRGRIDELRQVNSESTIRTLLERRLITVAGRADAPGRPFLYRTTELFLQTFGLGSLDDLPPRPAALLPEKWGGSERLNLEDLPGFGEAEFDEAAEEERA